MQCNNIHLTLVSLRRALKKSPKKYDSQPKYLKITRWIVIRLNANLDLFSSLPFLLTTVMFNGGSLTAHKVVFLYYEIQIDSTNIKGQRQEKKLMGLVVRQIAGNFYFAKFIKVGLILKSPLEFRILSRQRERENLKFCIHDPKKRSKD